MNCKNIISGENSDGTYIQMNCGNFGYFCDDCSHKVNTTEDQNA